MLRSALADIEAIVGVERRVLARVGDAPRITSGAIPAARSTPLRRAVTTRQHEVRARRRLSGSVPVKYTASQPARADRGRVGRSRLERVPGDEDGAVLFGVDEDHHAGKSSAHTAAWT
jgi:hypothetical protein